MINTKQEIFTFLDKWATINHYEETAPTLKREFGLTIPLALEYIREHQIRANGN